MSDDFLYIQVSPSGSEAIATKNTTTTVTQLPVTPSHHLNNTSTKPVHASFPLDLIADDQLKKKIEELANSPTDKNTLQRSVNTNLNNQAPNIVKVNTVTSSDLNDIAKGLSKSDISLFRPIRQPSDIRSSLSEKDITSGGKEVQKYMSVSPDIDVYGSDATYMDHSNSSKSNSFVYSDSFLSNSKHTVEVKEETLHEKIQRISDKYSTKRAKNNTMSDPETSISAKVDSINEKYKVRRKKITEGHGVLPINANLRRAKMESRTPLKTSYLSTRTNKISSALPTGNSGCIDRLHLTNYSGGLLSPGTLTAVSVLNSNATESKLPQDYSVLSNSQFHLPSDNVHYNPGDRRRGQYLVSTDLNQEYGHSAGHTINPESQNMDEPVTYQTTRDSQNTIQEITASFSKPEDETKSDEQNKYIWPGAKESTFKTDLATDTWTANFDSVEEPTIRAQEAVSIIKETKTAENAQIKTDMVAAKSQTNIFNDAVKSYTEKKRSPANDTIRNDAKITTDEYQYLVEEESDLDETSEETYQNSFEKELGERLDLTLRAAESAAPNKSEVKATLHEQKSEDSTRKQVASSDTIRANDVHSSNLNLFEDVDHSEKSYTLSKPITSMFAAEIDDMSMGYDTNTQSYIDLPGCYGNHTDLDTDTEELKREFSENIGKNKDVIENGEGAKEFQERQTFKQSRNTTSSASSQG